MKLSLKSKVMLFLHVACRNGYGLEPIRGLKFVFEYEDLCRENILEAVEKGKILCSEFKLIQDIQKYIDNEYLDSVAKSHLEYSLLLEKVTDSEGNVLWNNNKNFFEESVPREREFDAVRGQLTSTYGKYIVNFAIQSFDNYQFVYNSVLVSANYPLEAIRKAGSMLSNSIYPVGEYIIRPRFVFDLETDYVWEPEEYDEEVDSSIQVNWTQRLIEQENGVYYQGKVDFVFEEEEKEVLEGNEPREQKEVEFTIGLCFYIRNYPFQDCFTDSVKMLLFERVYTTCDSENPESEVMGEAEEIIRRINSINDWTAQNRGWIRKNGNPFLEKVELGFISQYSDPMTISLSKLTSRYSFVFEIDLGDTEFNLTTEVLLPDDVSAFEHATVLKKILDQTLSLELVSIKKAETGDVVWSVHF